MDDRLVKLISLRVAIMSSIFYGYPERDVMLRNVADIWRDSPGGGKHNKILRGM